MRDETVSVKPGDDSAGESSLLWWRLLNSLRRLERGVLVAFSGGVDSTLLLKAAETALGAERVRAVHACSPLEAPAREQLVTEVFAKNFPRLGSLLQVKPAPFAEEEIAANGPRRCYHCKRNLYKVFAEVMQRGELLLDGTNADDLNEERPGLAAQREAGVITPLADCGLTKAQVRQLAQLCGLSNSLLASESCLATRLPQGMRLSPARLAAVAEAELALQRLGLPVARIKPVTGRVVVELWCPENEALERPQIDFPTLQAALQPLFWVFGNGTVEWRRRVFK